MDDVAVLSSISDPELLGELFATARDVKDAIYGTRLVLFAPLYVSNLCTNDCLYCAFRVRNKELKRRALTQDEIRREVEILVDQGHKRVLLVAGESYPERGLRVRPRLDRDDLRRQARPRRDPPRQRQRRAADGRRVPRPQGDRHRHLPALPGDLPPRDLRRRAPRRQEEGLRLARHGHGPRHGGRHRRRRHRRALRPLRLALRDPRPHAAHPRPRARVRRRAAHDQHAAPRAGDRLGHRPRSRRTPSSDVDFRKIVAILRLAVPYTGMIMTHARDAEHPPRDLRPRRLADLGRQPHQPGRLRRGRALRRGAVPARRPPLARRGHPRRGRARATSPRSAPPATGSAARAWTSWTSPSPATSSTTATPTRSRPSSSTCSTTGLAETRAVGDDADRTQDGGDGRRPPPAHRADARAGARRRARRALLTVD